MSLLQRLSLAALLASGPALATDAGSATANALDPVGAEVVVEGKLAQIPWQHLIHPPPGKSPLYVDLDGGGQIVAYVPKGEPCLSRVRLTGKVVEVSGRSKRPGSKERFTERSLDVTRIECLDAASIEPLLDRLADPALASDRKRDVEEELLRAGKPVIPVLIAHLSDARVFSRDTRIMNLNLLMNAPGHLPPPKPEEREVVVTLGARCDWLLRRLITPPRYHSAFAGNFKPRDVGYDSYLFRVADWPAWWARNQDKPLAEIREELKPVVDAYWKQRGTEQLVQ
ncbi:MAG: hypothetical protein ACYC8T_13755 [Myxococcaceae bacterium]